MNATKLRKTLVSFALAGVTVMSVNALADPPQGGYGPGYGMGPGMMGAGPMRGLELSRDQQEQMARIETELRKRNWSLQGGIIDARGELLELYADETPDPNKIGAVYGKIFDLRRQMIEATIEAQNRQRAILTDEQRSQLRTGPYGGMHDQHHHRMTAE